ncbi:microtubule-actin cross-linking factor 1 isoform X3 [Ciona intestinalis]
MQHQEYDDDSMISSQRLNRSSVDILPWEVDDSLDVSAEDASSGRLSAFYLSSLKQAVAEGTSQLEVDGAFEMNPPENADQEKDKKVIDAAERAVLRVADERDQVQRKTFTKWVNKYLSKQNRRVDNLYEDFRDGHNLIALLEALSGTSLPREKGRMRFHRLQNVQIALDFLKGRKLRLVNIRNDDITDGNPKLTLGLVWNIILHFQIEDITVEGTEDLSAKQALLIWAQRNMEGYDGIKVTNFSSSWRDGKAFNAILHRNNPELIDMNKVMANDNRTNLDQAFAKAENKFGVTRLLDTEDVDVDRPDERSVITYVSSLYDKFPQVPPLPTSVTKEEWQYAWEEYRLLTTSLFEWIQTQTCILCRRDDIQSAESPAQVKALIVELKRFETEDVPLKEADLRSLVSMYVDVQELSSKSRGKYMPVSGFEPKKVVNAWEGMVDEMSERDNHLTVTFNRLNALHEVTLKIAKGADECNDKLNQANAGIQRIMNGEDDAKLHSDVKALLDSCDGDIRTLFVDVQSLKNSDYYQAEDMYKTVFALHEKWIALKSEYNMALQHIEQIRLDALANMKPKLEDTNEYKFLVQCIKWVEEKQATVDNFAWGTDFPTVKQQIEDFAKLQKEIKNFEKSVHTCQHENKNKFENGSSDFVAYCQLLSTLEVNYQLLCNSANTRSAHLDSLIGFVRDATTHLMWMNQKEDDETVKSIPDYDAPTLEQEYLNLMGDIEAREPSYTSTLKKGEQLVQERHPANNVVSAYLTALKDQWQRVLHLMLCHEQHVKDLTQHDQFCHNCAIAERKLEDCNKDIQDLNETIEDGIKLSDAQEISNKLNKLQDEVADLKKSVDVIKTQSNVVPCVEERRVDAPCEKNVHIQALVTYRGDNIAVAKGEDCILLHKGDDPAQNWSVQTASGQTGSVPSLVFRIPPPSSTNIRRADALDEDLEKLSDDQKLCENRWKFYKVVVGNKENCQNVLSWNIDTYRTLTPTERENALHQLADDLNQMEDVSRDIPDNTTPHIHKSSMDVNLCRQHVEDLEKKLQEENDLEETCQSYISRLNVLLRRISDVHDTVMTRVSKDLPQDKEEVQVLLQEQEASANELSRLEPHYSQTCDDSRKILESNPTTPMTEQLSTQLDVVVDKWNNTWNITYVYLNKIKVVHLILVNMDEAGNIVSDVEQTLSVHDVDLSDRDQLLQQQEVFLSRCDINTNLRDQMNQKSTLFVRLEDHRNKMQDVEVKLSEAVNAPAPSKDVGECSERADDLLQRWKVCKVKVDDRLNKITAVLPQAEKALAEEKTSQSLIARLRKLLEKIQSIEEKEKPLTNNPLPHDKDALADVQNTQQGLVDKVEDLKTDYDCLQAEVVNFVNHEATGAAPSLPELREALHDVQECWTRVWLITHIFLEKIRGVTHTIQALKVCEGAVENFETAIADDCDTDDLAEVQLRNQRIKNLLGACDNVDNSFGTLRKNHSSTRGVVSQFPPEMMQGPEVEDLDTEITALEERWGAAKAKLMILAANTEKQCLKLQKASSMDREASDLLHRVLALNAELSRIEQSQTTLIQMPLSHDDKNSIERCMLQQNHIGEKLHLLSGDYFTLSAECTNNHQANGTDDVSFLNTTLEKLDDAERIMHQLWEELNKVSQLYATKLAVLKEAVVKIHDFEDTTSNYEQCIEKPVDSADVNELKKLRAQIMQLAAEVPKQDETAQATKSKVGEVENAGEQLMAASPTALDAHIEPDVDAEQCKSKYVSVDERWEAVKSKLADRLEQVDAAITDNLAVAETERTNMTLLSEIESLCSEIGKVENAQLVRADVMLPNDVTAVNRVINQQKVMSDKLENELQPRYDDLSERSSQQLATTPDSPTKDKLQHATSHMNDSWENVRQMVSVYMQKLYAINALLEALAIARPVVKDYEVKILKAQSALERDGQGMCDPVKIRDACAILQELKEQANEDQKKIDDLQSALDDSLASVPNPEEDQDISANAPVAQKVLDDWNRIQQQLHLVLNQLNEELPHAEKLAGVEKSVQELLPALHNIGNELDGIKHTIQARICVSMPAETDSMEKAIAQQKVTADRLKEIKDNLETLKQRSEPIMQVDTASVKHLKDDFNKLDDQWNSVNDLSDQYLEKLSCMQEAVSTINVTRGIVTSYETQLLIHDTMASTEEGLQKQREILQKLDSEVPTNDPKFVTMADSCECVKQQVDKMNETTPGVDSDEYPDVARKLIDRWNLSKYQVKERLAYALVGEAKLQELQKEAELHKEWLNAKEERVNSDELNTTPSGSEEIKVQLDEHEKEEGSVTSQYPTIDKMRTITAEFDTAARKYDQTALEYEPPIQEGVDAKPKPSPEEMEENSSKRKKIIEYEVITITRRYDKMKNLLSEKIDRLKVDYKDAKERELKEYEDLIKAYEEKLAEVIPWLPGAEERIQNACELPVPVEPKALREQVKACDAMNEEILGKVSAMEEMVEASDALAASPINTWTYETSPDKLKENSEKLTKRYEDLKCKSQDLSSKLHNTLFHSENVSKQLEILLSTLEDVAARLQNNKATSVAQSNAVEDSIKDMEGIQESLIACGKDINELQQKCTDLVGSGDAQACDSLQKRMRNLADRHSELTHDSNHWMTHLSEMNDKLENFQTHSVESENFMQKTGEGLNKFDEKQNSVVFDPKLGHAEVTRHEDIIREARLTLENMQNDLDSLEKKHTDTLSAGDDIVLNSRLNSVAPVQDALDKSKASWKELKAEIKQREDMLNTWEDKLNKFKSSSSLFEDWLRGCEDEISSMEDTILIPRLDAQIQVCSKHIESLDNHVSEFDDLCEVAASLPGYVIQSPLKYHKKGKGDDMMTILKHRLDDLTSNLETKHSSLKDTKNDVTDFKSKYSKFEEMLSTAEEEEIAWLSKLSSIELHSLPDAVKEYKVWRDSLLVHEPELKELEDQSSKIFEAKPSAEGVSDLKNEMKITVSRWNSLLSASLEKLETLKRKSETKDQFDSLLERFKEWLDAKRALFELLDAPTFDLASLEKQNDKLNALQADIESHKPQLEKLEQLVSQVPQLQPTFQPCNEDWEDLCSSVANLADKNKNTTKMVEKLDKLSSEVKKWSPEFCQQLDAAPKPTEKDAVHKALQDLEKQKETEIKENEEKCVECHKIQSELFPEENSSDKTTEEKVRGADDALEDARSKMRRFEEDLMKMADHMDEIKRLSEKLKSWSKPASADANAIFDPEVLIQEDIKTTAEKLKKMLENGNKLQPTHNKVVELCEEMKENCSEDELKFAFDAMEDYNTVKQEISDMVEKLTNQLENLRKFHEEKKRLEKFLCEVEQQTQESESTLSNDVGKKKNLLEQLVKELDNKAFNVFSLCDSAKSLVSHTRDDASEPSSPTAASDHITGAANDVAEKFRELKMTLAALLSDVDEVFSKLNTLKNQLEDALQHLTDLEEDLDQCDPISREDGRLEDQMMEVEELCGRGEDLKDEVEVIDQMFKNLLDAGVVSQNSGMKKEISNLSRRSSRLSNQLKRRKSNISDVRKRLAQFGENRDEASKNLDSVIEEVEKFDKDAANVEEVRELQVKYKTWSQSKVDPLRLQIAHARDIGHVLVFGADPSVQTFHIKHDINQLDAKWNKLSDLMTEYEVWLQRSLIDSGHFNDVYDSLLAWLDEAETLAANQKPASWEYKVVAAQLEEHKVFEKMINSQHEMMSYFLREGTKSHDIMDKSYDDEVKKMTDMRRRWLDLCENHKKRDVELRRVTSEAEDFHLQSSSFLTWMEGVKKTVDVDVTGSHLEHIENQIRQQKTLMTDILQHEPHLLQIRSTPLRESMIPHPPLSSSLKNFIEKMQYDYDEVRRMNEGRLRILEEQRQLCRAFDENLLNLLAFLAETDLKLKKWENKAGNLSLIDARPDYITSVLQACQLVKEELTSKHQTVEDSVKEGRVLLSKCPGDDNELAHKKLDSLNMEYNLLLQRSSVKVDALQTALVTSQRVKDTHERIGDWLSDSNLKIKEIRVSKKVDLHLMKEAVETIKPAEHENDVEIIKRDSTELSNISHWWGDKLLQEHFNQDSVQYNTIKDCVALFEKQVKAIEEKLNSFSSHVEIYNATLLELDQKVNSFKKLESMERGYLSGKQAQKEEINTLVAKVKVHSESLVDEAENLMSELVERDALIVKQLLTAYLSELDRVLESKNSCMDALGGLVSLAIRWYESCDHISPWLREMETRVEDFIAPGKNNDIQMLQDQARVLEQDLTEHKPLITRLTKIDVELHNLIDTDEEELLGSISNTTEQLTSRYNQLCAKVSGKTNKLNETSQQLNNFFNNCEKLLEQVSLLKDQLLNLEPIPMEPEFVKERIARIKKYEVEAGKHSSTCDVMTDQGEELKDDLSSLGCDKLKEVVDIKMKQLRDLCSELSNFSENQLHQLNGAFQCLLQFRENSDLLMTKMCSLLESVDATVLFPITDLQSLTDECKFFEKLGEEVTHTGEEVSMVEQISKQCIAFATPMGHEVSYIRRRVEEVDSMYAKLRSLFEKNRSNLQEQLDAAIKFQDAVRRTRKSLEEQSDKLESLPIVATDLDEIKKQIENLKIIRQDCVPLQVEAQNLSNQIDQLSPQQTNGESSTIDGVSQLQTASKTVEDKITQRQSDLDNALLALGQLQHAIEEMVNWMEHVSHDMDKHDQIVDKCPINPRAVETEMSKHRIMYETIQSQKSTLDGITMTALNLSAQQTDESADLNNAIENMSQQWDNLNAQADTLMQKLKEKLNESYLCEEELSNIEYWVDEKEAEMSSSLFFGGLPETSQAMLDEHLAFMKELELKQTTLDNLVEAYHVNDRGLKRKLDALQKDAEIRKTKLEEMRNEANTFHENLQNFMGWLGQAEQCLANRNEVPLSVLKAEAIQQLSQHKEFEEEVQGKREEFLELDKLGSHLKYFSQKQDGILIKNLLLSVHAKWDKLMSATSARSSAVNELYKKSIQFHDGLEKLSDWIHSAEEKLEYQQTKRHIEEPGSIKAEMDEHKEFHQALASKQPVYEAVMRSGISLHEKAVLVPDKTDLDEKTRKLKEEWTALNKKSVDRKHRLEESLLFSGRFLDAIESLIQWLSHIEPQLSKNVSVHGDIHTVEALMEKHNILRNELTARHANVKALQESFVHERADSWVNDQMQELIQRWNEVAELVKYKQGRLEDAHKQAQLLQTSAHKFLEYLSQVESNLCLTNKLPNDEFKLQELRVSHLSMTSELKMKEEELSSIISLAESILQQAHPDAVTPLRQLIKVLRSKWGEVLQKCDDHGRSLDEAISRLKEDMLRMENLGRWLDDAEKTLQDREKQPIDIEKIHQLIEEHQQFQDEMVSKQPEYDNIVSLYSKRKQVRPAKKGEKSPRSPPGETADSAMEIACDNLHTQWQRVWIIALERQRKLQEAEETARRTLELSDFLFDAWRKRYMKWMKHKKSRVMDFFRNMDKDGDGKVTRQQFIDGILKSKFPTDEMEMSKVADIFDRDNDGYIDYYEFVAALYPTKETYRPETDADKIEDEVVRQVAKCTCCKRFQVQQIAENKYRFGDNQQLRLVRILRSTVMVRVGGGWMALDEFLLKNDPCRAKGRTNYELREKFILPAGASQAMTPFKTKRTSTASRTSTPDKLSSPKRQMSKSRESLVSVGSTRSSKAGNGTPSPVHEPKTSTSSIPRSSIPKSTTPARKRPSKLPSREKTTPKR